MIAVSSAPCDSRSGSRRGQTAVVPQGAFDLSAAQIGLLTNYSLPPTFYAFFMDKDAFSTHQQCHAIDMLSLLRQLRAAACMATTIVLYRPLGTLVEQR